MKRFLPFAALALLLPTSVFAMESIAWSFRGPPPNGTVPQNLTTAEATMEGLYIDTQTDGFLQLPPLMHAVDTMRLRVTSAHNTDIALIWHTADLKTGEYYQNNVTLPAGESKDVTIELHQIPEWQWNAPMIGIALPAGARLLIEHIEWRRYTLTEKAWNGFASFWTTDQFRLYSINFLWGPLLGTTPEARAGLYETLPPQSWSALRLIYAALAAAAAIGGILWVAKPEGGRRRFILIVAIAGTALWTLLDLRMTQEILSYAADDWRTYVLAPAEERTLRTHSDLYDVMPDIDELLGDDARYVLIVADNTPFFGNVRYALYPAVPMRTNDDTSGVGAYVVLARPDVTVVNGILTGKDGPLSSKSGTIVRRFDDTSFFFRISRP